MFLLRDLPKCASQSHKAAAYHMLSRFGKIFLPVGTQQRNGGTKPPESCDQKGKDHGRLHADDTSRSKHDRQAYDKRNTASDIAPRIAVR